MKKATLIVILLLTAMLMQYCNKDSVSASSDNGVVLPLQAYINDTTWTPVSPNYNFGVTYTAATQSRTFAFTGTSGIQQINFAVTLPKSSSIGTGFPLGTYSVDGTSRVVMTYGRANSTSPSVYVPQGTVKAGYVIVTAIDSVNLNITGEFSFNTTQYNYDNLGNLTSLYVNQISSGAFNSIPYAFKKN